MNIFDENQNTVIKVGKCEIMEIKWNRKQRNYKEIWLNFLKKKPQMLKLEEIINGILKNRREKDVDRKFKKNWIICFDENRNVVIKVSRCEIMQIDETDNRENIKKYNKTFWWKKPQMEKLEQ